MEQFIADLSADYQLNNYKVKQDLVVFEISSKLNEIKCPYCGHSSRKIHSYYQREVQDLPMQNKKVILLIKTRKMFCTNDKCNKKTFSEKHAFVEAKGKKTKRLERNIIYASTQLSSVNASLILKSGNIDICKSSICSLLKKNAVSCG